MAFFNCYRKNEHRVFQQQYFEAHMKLTFLGSGSAFAVDGNYQSNAILQTNSGKILLIDCGTDIRLSLLELDLSYKNISHVYLSHLHADHVGGLEWLAFTTKFNPTCEKPTLYIPEAVLKDLWNKTLSGGLSSLEGIDADITTYFNTYSIASNESFIWEGIEFYIVQTLHFISGYAIMPSYGLIFSIDGCTIFFTADAQFTPLYFNPLYKQANIIFHDCETTDIHSGLHAHYSDLKTLDSEIKKKIWLYHYSENSLLDAKKDGFAGFVRKGQSFLLPYENT